MRNKQNLKKRQWPFLLYLILRSGCASGGMYWPCTLYSDYYFYYLSCCYKLFLPFLVTNALKDLRPLKQLRKCWTVHHHTPNFSGKMLLPVNRLLRSCSLLRLTQHYVCCGFVQGRIYCQWQGLANFFGIE